MAAPVLTFRDSAGDPLAAAVEITATAGTPGTATEIQLTHDSGDQLRDARLKAFVRDSGETTWQRESHEWGSQGIPQARITEGLGGLAVSATAWTNLGAGSYLPLPDLQAGEGLVLEFRLDAPPDTSVPSAQINPVVTNDRGEEVGAAVSLIMGDGIVLPFRDSSAYALAYIGGAIVENPGGADDQVQLPHLIWIGGGIPWGKAAHLVTLDDEDSAAATLAPGEAYKARLTLADDGTVTQTKGEKDVAASAEAPAWPAGEVRLATVTRGFDGIINNVDIESVAALDLFGWSATSLTGTLGAGRNALVNGSLIYSTTPSQASLQASQTNRVYQNRGGSLTVSPAATPAPGSLLMHEAVTDGSGVTAHRDRRAFIGYNPGEAVFRWEGTVATASYRYAHVPGTRDAYVLPILGIVFSIGTQAVGAASGATTADVEYLDSDGTTWISLFDSGARPSIAYNATGLALVDRAIYPVRLVLPAGTLLRANLPALPAGGSADPKDATLTLRYAL